MPHAEIKYSADLSLDTDLIFDLIERVLNGHDSSSGVCKGRAYPASSFRHTHVLFEINILRKPHRDEAFVQGLVEDLERQLKGVIGQSCYFSLAVDFSPVGYVTNQYLIDVTK